ncbi:hypothetical protein [Parafilimonas sp.]|uniref:hypothetical protein n=1 Tax=Parafilimonas sp. TaxID=1969739 RepID=UPI0039E302F2
MVQKYVACLVAVIVFPFIVNAQKIVYSPPDRDDVRSVDFDIIGKIGDKYLVHKQVRSNSSISVYDDGMQLTDKVKMDFLPDKIINSDIIAYRDYFYFIYQYQKRNIVYCTAAKMNSEGKIVGEPVILDTTAINFFASNKIYNVIYSEDKQKICVYKINSKDETNYLFTRSLFDASLSLLNKDEARIAIRPRVDFLTEFALDNDGWMVFVKASGSAATSNNGSIQGMTLMMKPPNYDNISTYVADVPKVYLDDIRVKVDNINRHVLIASFYEKQKRGNVDGLYCALWNRNTNAFVNSNLLEFNDQLKSNAKSEGSARAAFNDYFLQSIILRKDGGFAVLSESAYSSSRGVYNNRWNYLYGSPYWGSSNFYMYGSPFGYYSYPWMNPYGFGGPQINRYYADNIAVLSFDSTAAMEWASVVPKSQYDDNSDNFIGYGTFITSGEINFLFNQFEKRTLLLQAQSIDPQGKRAEAPTLKSLDRGYQFMPRYLKQIGSRSVLIPCQYRNYLCFAKIEF